MRIRELFYASYETHNFCSKCNDKDRKGWILKEKSPGIYCPYCGSRLRHNNRYAINKEVHRY